MLRWYNLEEKMKKFQIYKSFLKFLEKVKRREINIISRVKKVINRPLINKNRVELILRKVVLWIEIYVIKNFVFWGFVFSILIVYVIKKTIGKNCLSKVNLILFFLLVLTYFIELDFFWGKNTEKRYPFLYKFLIRDEFSNQKYKVKYKVFLFFLIFVVIIMLVFEQQDKGGCSSGFLIGVRIFQIILIIQTVFLLIDALIEYKDMGK